MWSVAELEPRAGAAIRHKSGLKALRLPPCCGPAQVVLNRYSRPTVVARLCSRFFARTEHGGAHYKYWYDLPGGVQTAYAYSKGEAYKFLRIFARHCDLQIDWNVHAEMAQHGC